jgi:hypothetical protein
MNKYFALNTPKIDVDPDLNNIFLGVFAIFFLAGIGVVVWHFAPILYEKRKLSRAAKSQSKNSIWYDPKESELHSGDNKIRIEPKSLEHYVCKITFNSPSKYIDDYTVFEDRDNAVSRSKAKESRRGVEQAVRRLNDKGRKLGLKTDLLKRSKERTSVNDEYRLRITKN